MSSMRATGTLRCVPDVQSFTRVYGLPRGVFGSRPGRQEPGGGAPSAPGFRLLIHYRHSPWLAPRTKKTAGAGL
jgi:hypothetical protein